VSVSEIFSNLFNGNTIYILDDVLKKDPMLLYKYVNDNNIEVCYFPPALIGILPYDENIAIKKIIFAGEKINKDVGVTWSKRIELYNYYGPAEGTIYVTGKMVNTDNPNEIGKPINNVVTRIVDDDMNIVQNGEKGELLISGICLARGYLNLPEQTNKSFIANPFGEGRIYKTGDVVRLNENGDIEFIGRKDNQVNIRGKRIELNEIFETMMKINIVDNCAIKCKDTEDNINEFIYCYYTIKNKEYNIYDGFLNILPKNITNNYNNIVTNELKKTLLEFMIPQYFILIDKFELNSSGKIDGNKLLPPSFDDLTYYNGDLKNNEKYIILNEIMNCVSGTSGINYDPYVSIDNMGIDSLRKMQFYSEMFKRSLNITKDDFVKPCSISNIINCLVENKKNNYLDIMIEFGNMFEEKNLHNDDLNEYM
jgi:surfactin family lipopeptide synthetase A